MDYKSLFFFISVMLIDHLHMITHFHNSRKYDWNEIMVIHCTNNGLFILAIYGIAKAYFEIIIWIMGTNSLVNNVHWNTNGPWRQVW